MVQSFFPDIGNLSPAVDVIVVDLTFPNGQTQALSGSPQAVAAQIASAPQPDGIVVNSVTKVDQALGVAIPGSTVVVNQPASVVTPAGSSAVLSAIANTPGIVNLLTQSSGPISLASPPQNAQTGVGAASVLSAQLIVSLASRPNMNAQDAYEIDHAAQQLSQAIAAGQVSLDLATAVIASMVALARDVIPATVPNVPASATPSNDEGAVATNQAADPAIPHITPPSTGTGGLLAPPNNPTSPYSGRTWQQIQDDAAKGIGYANPYEREWFLEHSPLHLSVDPTTGKIVTLLVANPDARMVTGINSVNGQPIYGRSVAEIRADALQGIGYQDEAERQWYLAQLGQTVSNGVVTTASQAPIDVKTAASITNNVPPNGSVGASDGSIRQLAIDAANKAGLNPTVFANLMAHEGNGKVASNGAVFGILPSTAAIYGYTSSQLANNPQLGLKAATQYLVDVTKYPAIGNDTLKIFTAYYLGPGSVTEAVNNAGANWLNYIDTVVAPRYPQGGVVVTGSQFLHDIGAI